LNLGWLSDSAIGSTRLHDCVDYRCQRVLLERHLQRWKMILSAMTSNIAIADERTRDEFRDQRR
jgi:hypothetical protein